MAINRAQGAMLQHQNVDPSTLATMSLLPRQYPTRPQTIMGNQMQQQQKQTAALPVQNQAQTQDLKIQIPNSVLQAQLRNKNPDDAYVPAKRGRHKKREKINQTGPSYTRAAYHVTIPSGFLAPKIENSLGALTDKCFNQFVKLFSENINDETREEKVKNFINNVYNIHFAPFPHVKDVLAYFLDLIRIDNKLIQWVDNPPIPSVLSRYPQRQPKFICTKNLRGHDEFFIPNSSQESSIIVIGTIINPFVAQIFDINLPILVNGREHLPISYGELQKKYYILHSGSCPSKPLRISLCEAIEKSFAFLVIQVCFQKSEETIMREIVSRFDPYPIYKNLPDRLVMSKHCQCPAFPLGRFVENLLQTGSGHCPICQRIISINELCPSRTPLDGVIDIDGRPNRTILAEALCFVTRPLESGNPWAKVVFDEEADDEMSPLDDVESVCPARDTGDEYRRDFLTSATNHYQ